MNSLDDESVIKQYDSANVVGSIGELGDQCLQAWEEVSKIKFPQPYFDIQNIIFSGMGGSALGAYVVKSLFFKSLPVPFEVINDYHLPPYVNEKTLVILGTYSGTTEETLSCAFESKVKHACVSGITTGGQLGEFLTANSYPGYIFKPVHNPSNQPRLGSGYSVFGLIVLLSLLNLISVNKTDLEEIEKVLREGNLLYGIKSPGESNPAKKMAQEWSQKIPVIIAAEFLTNVGRVIRNQIHETAKSFAAFHDLPELNHHLMEALANPKTNKDELKFLFLFSDLYEQRIKKRFEITRQVIEKNGITVSQFTPTSTNKIAQVFESIQFGAYVNFYMAILYGVDPSKIPWVDFFKKELGK